MSEKNQDTTKIELSELGLSDNKIKALKEADIEDVKGLLEVDLDFLVEEVDGFGRKTAVDAKNSALKLYKGKHGQPKPKDQDQRAEDEEKEPEPELVQPDARKSLLIKLGKVRDSVEYLQKTNEGDNFKFVSSSQAVSSIRAEMKKQNLLLIPEIDNNRSGYTYHEEQSQKIFTEIHYQYVWVDIDTGYTISIPWYAQGVDYHEKGLGKALTYGEKYFILKFFQIPTDDADPDKFQESVEKQNKTPKSKKDFKKKRQIFTLLNKVSDNVNKDNAKSLIEEKTKLELNPDNYDGILTRLNALLEEKKEAEEKEKPKGDEGRAEEKLKNAQNNQKKKESDIEKEMESELEDDFDQTVDEFNPENE